MKLKVFIGFLLITIFYSPLEAHSQDKMKVLSYNIFNGFRSDSVIQEKYLQWVRVIDPDVVAYQEMNHFTQERLESLASQYGHPYAVLSKTEGYPVALSSKYPIVNVQKVIDNMWHAYLYANINSTHVFVVHLSPHVYEKRHEELKLVLAHAATLPKDEGIIIMGDFNSFDKRDASHYGDDMLKEFQEREIKNKHRNLNDGEIDYSVIDQMTASGFKDAYRLVNDNFKSSKQTKVKKYDSYPNRRIDYIWVNPVLEKHVIKADIIHDKDTDWISDHYPMYMELYLK